MSIARILVIRFSSLGDIILLTPLFREIKKRFPESQLDFLTSTTFASVCSNNPHIDSITAFDRNRKGELKRTIKWVKKNRYDLILDAHHSLRSRLLLLSGYGPRWMRKTRTISIDKRSWKRNLLITLKINLLKNAIAQREAYCSLLDTITSNHDYDTSTELYPGKTDHENTEKILRNWNLSDAPIAAIGPSASFLGKSWPKENYFELAKRLTDKGYIVILLGGKGDEEPGWIAERANSGVINLAGKLSYLETTVVLQKALFTISNDSAIVHFSEAVGTPVFSIFGPTAKEFGFAPFLANSTVVELELPCRPCSRNGKGRCKNPIDRECLRSITVDMVFKRIANLEKELRKSTGN